ncbi:MAG: aminotransferase class I/II-fold pyridoxal phosphate-dependent enzyme [Polyangiaceae bacterium]|nr:aminotransferase class I/II-fold pyridoxal phosphate-dependent enzyme [Polyangiaceae bacterium]MCL4752552.1 aminotransferase class I/II-fold pyridoxal phosphate-dependent enzyme [Myxococcales bacterium]
MGLKDKISERGKKILLSPTVMRWVSDDRVMRGVEGLMDAPSRMKAAWAVLKNGHDLPAIDPAVDDSMGEIDAAAAPSPKPKANGSAAHVPTSARSLGSEDMKESLKERSSLSGIGGRDVFEKCFQFSAADNARKMGIYPFFRPLDLNDGPEAVIDGKRVVMFGSNNYLGLTTHPKVREAAKAAIDRFGTSMTGSRLVNGSMKMHEEFEHKLAAWFGKESALVFTTGYQVNIATCSALLSNKKSVAVIDRNVHASLYDGVRLGQSAGARLVRYRHNDAESLDKALEKVDAGEGALVVTDGVFSAEGEIAKLDELVPVVKKHGARVFVDDAHALGVIGPGGRGTAHHFGLENQVDLMGGTFSKSLASIGGWLVGERKVLDYIRHFAPSFLFAAAAAPPNVAAAMAAFELMQEESWRIQKLHDNFTYMRDGLKSLGFDLGHTQTSVIPIYIREDLRTIMMWRDLLEEYGIYTNPFISPGVPPKHAMLRTSYMATHEKTHLDRGLEAFEKVGKKYGVI